MAEHSNTEAQALALRQVGISPLYYFYRDLLGVAAGGGRTVGRKIGVVQEIVVRKLLQRSQAISERLLLERFLPGFSGAAHKVEFVIYSLHRRLLVGQIFISNGLEIEIKSIGEKADLGWRIAGQIKWNRATLKTRSAVSKKLAFELEARSLALLLPSNPTSVSVLNTKDVLASVESKRVGAQIFVGSDKLGSGIQTIEKAKQTSLVAIDADLNFNRVVRPIFLRDGTDPENRRYISIVTLGNGVHWTANDHNVLKTYVDHTYLVHDDVMIRYGKFVEKIAHLEGVPIGSFFMTYFDGMTKAKVDDFFPSVNDLSVIEPVNDTRDIVTVLEAHIKKHNPLEKA